MRNHVENLRGLGDGDAGSAGVIPMGMVWSAK